MDSLIDTVILDNEIDSLQGQLTEIKQQTDLHKIAYTDKSAAIQIQRDLYVSTTKLCSEEIEKATEMNCLSQMQLNGNKTKYSSLCYALSTEIKKLENIKDICPTCNQNYQMCINLILQIKRKNWPLLTLTYKIALNKSMN